MKVVKTDLRNRMRGEWLNDSLVVYMENEIFDSIDNELILNRFQIWIVVEINYLAVQNIV